jgi:UDP-N-acetylglucosamine 2-epimerase (hydrolysing)
MKTILFVTGTRADFGKLKPLIASLSDLIDFKVEIFVTGMHMLKKYGSTYEEVLKAELCDTYLFVNQHIGDDMDSILTKSISGMSDYVKEKKPDLVIVHGDRVEALAGAIVCLLNGILLAHIEGGELSGTVDESMRHAISKIAQIHLVSNQESQKRLIQMGELTDSIHVIGSPEVDVIKSEKLPLLSQTKQRYEIPFEDYAVMIFHPVTTEIDSIKSQINEVVDYCIGSNENFVVIYPNNDSGSEYIQEAYSQLDDNSNFRVLPSMRFENFLSLLKGAKYMIGNSSSGVREAPYFAVPVINVGTRQNNRSTNHLIINCVAQKSDIIRARALIDSIGRVMVESFGEGDSAAKFKGLVQSSNFWATSIQKTFVDLP